MSPKLVFYVIQLFEGFGMGSFFPIYTPWLELHGLNFFKMGAVNFFYHISTSVLDPFTGFIADKFGKRKTFIVGQILWTTTQYIYGASSQITGFLLAEGIAAIGNSLKSDALESWLQNRLGEKESSLVMGKSRSLFTIGQIITSVLAGYISVRFGMNVAWYVSGTFFLIATILGSIVLIMAGDDLLKVNEELETTPNVNIRQIFSLAITNKKIVSTALLVALYSFATKPMFMFWPQIVSSLNMPDAVRGWSILFMSVPVMIGSLFAGHNRFFTRNVEGLIKDILVIGLGLIISAFAKNLIWFFVGLTVVEFAYGAINIITYGYLFNEVHPKHRSTVNSMISSAKTIGGAISLLVMGEIADLFTPQISIAVGGTLILLILLFYVKSKK